MGFWDSFKAGFFGSAGVDYYAKQSRDELRGLRSDLRDASPDSTSAVGQYMLQVQRSFQRSEASLASLQAALAAGGWEAIRVAAADGLRVFEETSSLMPKPHDPIMTSHPRLGLALLEASSALLHFKLACLELTREEDPDRAGASHDFAAGLALWNDAGDHLDRSLATEF